MISQLVNTFTLNPKKLFLFDAFGALLSAFLLGIVLTNFQPIFGMPLRALYILAALPCLFAIYDFMCFYFLKTNWAFHLKVIAIVNLVYCFISIGFMLDHFHELKTLGFIYFILEIIIVLIMVFIEFKTTKKLKSI